MILQVPFLNEYTDKEKDILGKYSSNLFTLNTFYIANKKIVGSTDLSDTAEHFLVSFWTCVSKNIVQWNELIKKEISKVDLRENYIVTQGVVVQALGLIGAYFYHNPTLDMNKYLSKLQVIDWKRNASQWKLRVIRSDGKIITSNKAILLTAIQIKKEIGLNLSEEEQNKEAQFLNSINI